MNPKILYTIFTFAGLHAAHDLYQFGGWVVGKVKSRKTDATANAQQAPSAQQHASA